MKAPRSSAARRALALFGAAPRSDRVHVRLRWWTAPLTAVERATPTRGRVLEIGCGHGLLSLYLGLSAPDRRVLGVDIDRDKVALARQAAARLGPDEAHVSFVPVDPGELPQGPFDAIVVCDVLYLLSAPSRTALLDAAADQLGAGGMLVIKETARTPRWKDTLNNVQERLATRVLRITVGDTVDFVEPRCIVEQLQGRGLTVEQRRVDRGYPHPHVLLTARRIRVGAGVVSEPEGRSPDRRRAAIRSQGRPGDGAGGTA